MNPGGMRSQVTLRILTWGTLIIQDILTTTIVSVGHLSDILTLQIVKI